MHSIFLYFCTPHENDLVDLKDKTIDYIFRTTWLAINKMYNEEASKFGTTMATGFALLSIDPENGTPSTSLGPKMGMEATSLSRTLKTMEEKGLIERKPNPEDGRGVLIHLTDFGKEKRDYSRDRVLIFNETIKANVTDEELSNFHKVAEVINNMISNKKIYNKEKQFQTK